MAVCTNFLSIYGLAVVTVAFGTHHLSFFWENCHAYIYDINNKHCFVVTFIGYGNFDVTLGVFLI
jgi:hypothetical protein